VSRVVVNDQPREVEAGLTVLAVLRRVGIDVPQLCDDDRLAPVGGLTGSGRDPKSHTPEYKRSAVRIEAARG
jgi:predicted molibdopterin-dependent oxidoreductase YjgC